MTFTVKLKQSKAFTFPEINKYKKNHLIGSSGITTDRGNAPSGMNPSKAYKLIKANFHELATLEREVNALLSEGWEAVGEVQQVQSNEHIYFIQQMEKQ